MDGSIRFGFSYSGPILQEFLTHFEIWLYDTSGETSQIVFNLKHAHATKFENNGAPHTTGYNCARAEAATSCDLLWPQGDHDLEWSHVVEQEAVEKLTPCREEKKNKKQ